MNDTKILGANAQVMLGDSALFTYLLDLFCLKHFNEGRSIHWKEISIRNADNAFIKAIEKHFKLTRVPYVSSHSTMLINDDIFINMSVDDLRNANINIYADESTCDEVFGYISSFNKRSAIMLSWVVKSEGVHVIVDKCVNSDKLPHPSFYPWLSKPLAEYYDAYLNSSANILVLSGPPGTGKTSFIKGLLVHANAGGFFTYDESILEDDNFFTMFLDNDRRFLILEDADKLLTHRLEGNSVMQKFLNLSEGLIDIGDKKIIFSTNIQNVRTIDPALLRPGRCFDLLQFRALSVEEAKVVAKYLGVDIEITQPMTLAQLAHPEQSVKVHAMGFTQ